MSGNVPYPEGPFHGDESAQEEARLFTDESLERASRWAEFQRREVVRTVLVYGALVLLVIFLLLLLAATVIVAYHNLLPIEKAWLAENQLIKVETFLFSGISGTAIGVTGAILRRYF